MPLHMADKKPEPHAPPPIGPREAKQLRDTLTKALTKLDTVELIPLESVEHGLRVLKEAGLSAAKLTGAPRQQVTDWKRDNFFATNTYLILSDQFRALGYYATPSLWRMKE